MRFVRRAGVFLLGGRARPATMCRGTSLRSEYARHDDVPRCSHRARRARRHRPVSRTSRGAKRVPNSPIRPAAVDEPPRDVFSGARRLFARRGLGERVRHIIVTGSLGAEQGARHIVARRGAPAEQRDVWPPKTRRARLSRPRNPPGRGRSEAFAWIRSGRFGGRSRRFRCGRFRGRRSRGRRCTRCWWRTRGARFPRRPWPGRWRP